MADDHEDQKQQGRGGGGEGSISNKNKKMRRSAHSWLRDRWVRELVRDKQRRLVEVPYTATLAHTFNALLANCVSAVPVAAPPGQWIGAGGSMILESDPATGAVRKHYIGMLTMLDVLSHIAELSDYDDKDLDRWMAVPVSTIIGHSLESLSLWTLNPNTSLLDCMETLSKGVHRALVPVESQTNQAVSVELVEESPGYRMLTQMDVLRFLIREQKIDLKEILSRSVAELGAISEIVFAVGKHTNVMDAIKSMRAAGLSAVPVVEDLPGDQILQDGKGKKLVETFSATDLRSCPIALLQSWLSISVIQFKERLSVRASNAAIAPIDRDDPGAETRRLITCYHETSMLDVIDSAVSNHVHRLWVIDEEGSLNGVVSLSDMIRVVRDSVLVAEQELQVAIS